MNQDSAEHKTSIAVWDLESPLVIGRSAKVKVGAKCSADCQLSGVEVGIRDDAARSIAHATLGAAPWPGTNGLYWAELEFLAPVEAGMYTWAATSLHGDGSSSFSFITVPPPDYSLTIIARDKATQMPVEAAEVRLNAYRATTDEQGLATIELPKGSYALTVWKLGYEAFSTSIDLTETRTVEVEISVEPEEKQPYWM
jgi:hypothetical protein